MKPLGPSNFRDCLPLRGRWLRYFFLGFAFLLMLLVLFGLVQERFDRFMSRRTRSRSGGTVIGIGNFEAALELYRADHGGKPPTTGEGLRALIQEPTDYLGACCWKGPYLNDVATVPHDSWGRAYRYQSPGPHGEPYWIISYGEDGRPGGTDEAEDVTCRHCGQQEESR